MRYIYVIFLSVVFITASCGQGNSNKDTDGKTTYYLIRHAEKDRSDSSNRNPDLKAEGQARADRWAQRFEDVDFDAIYSTDYNRTLQTATPTAQSKGLTVQSYDPSKLYNEEFQKATEGKTVLIVGHSNTTPEFANAIMGTKHFPEIDDSDNGNLFIITVSKDGKKSPKHEQMD